MGEWRVIGKGLTTVPAGTDTPLGGSTRLTKLPGESVFLTCFPDTNPFSQDLDWGWEFGGGNILSFYAARLSVDAIDEFRYFCKSNHSHDIDVRWTVIGVIPPP